MVTTMMIILVTMVMTIIRIRIQMQAQIQMLSLSQLIQRRLQLIFVSFNDKRLGWGLVLLIATAG